MSYQPFYDCISQMYMEGGTAVKPDNKTAYEYFKKAADKVRTVL